MCSYIIYLKRDHWFSDTFVFFLASFFFPPHPKFGKLCAVSPTILGPEIWHATHLTGPWIRFRKMTSKNKLSPKNRYLVKRKGNFLVFLLTEKRSESFKPSTKVVRWRFCLGTRLQKRKADGWWEGFDEMTGGRSHPKMGQIGSVHQIRVKFKWPFARTRYEAIDPLTSPGELAEESVGVRSLPTEFQRVFFDCSLCSHKQKTTRGKDKKNDNNKRQPKTRNINYLLQKPTTTATVLCPGTSPALPSNKLYRNNRYSNWQMVEIESG